MTAAEATGARARLEAKFTQLDLAEVSADGAFEGYASLFYKEDMGRDVVLPGAFRDSLAKRGASGVRMLFQHDPNQPIGTWLELREDARGLYCRGRITPDAARAREVLALMRARAIDGLSIGFKTVRARRDPTRGIRRLEKIDLWEISIVTFPLLPEARIGAIKSSVHSAGPPTERTLERRLTQDAGLSRSEARALMRSGLQGLVAKQDAGATISEDAHLAARIAGLAHRFRTANL